MFEQNLSNLIDRRINLLISKKKSSRVKKSLFPQIKINPFLRNINQGLRNKKSPTDMNFKIQQPQPYSAQQILLVAKRIYPRQQQELIEIRKQFNRFNQSQIILSNTHEDQIRKQKEKQKQRQQDNLHFNFNLATNIKNNISNVTQNAQNITNISLIHNLVFHTQKSENKKIILRNKHYSYYIGYGNNQNLVRQIMKTRTHWKQAKKGEGVPNFKWLSNIQDYNFKKNHSGFNIKRIVNHFQNHHQITTKNGLIKNLQIYTQTKKQQLFSLTPITFLIDFDDQNCQYNLKQFLSFFLKNDPKRPPPNTTPPQIWNKYYYHTITTFIDNFFGYMTWQNSQIIKKLNPLSKPFLYSCYTKDDNYIWLLKPTGLNRGRGIQIFDNLQNLQKLFTNFLNLIGRKKTKQRTISTLFQEVRQKTINLDEQKQVQTQIQLNGEEIVKQIQKTKQVQKGPETFILNKCSFVIQKYIQQPLLIQDRKFDIRVWVLLKHDFTLLFFKQGYLRTSSQKYCMDISNYFIHLTNNAVQQYSKQYGNFQNGNQLSFAQFKQFLIKKQAPVSFQQILEKMKILCYKSMKSVKSKINPFKRKYCFQIFGFDFILDKNYKVWLIQVNTNPCIQQSSPLLKQLIPRMINDAFKITLDQIFPKRQMNQQQGNGSNNQEAFQMSFSVQNYSDKQNMWQSLGKLGPNSQYKK